jgi:hypothetical protein
MSRRKDRVQRAAQDESGAALFLSGQLLELALHHLDAALRERATAQFRSSTNHHALHALGCVVMLAAALEALVNTLLWVDLPRNEVALASPSNRAKSSELQNVLRDETIRAKYRRLLGASGKEPDDLPILSDLRDEILHFIPAMTQRGSVPRWFCNLEKRGLFLGNDELPPGSKGYFPFVEKLCSYKLAYWAFEVTEDAMTALRGGSSVFAPKVEHDLKILAGYRTVVSPSALVSVSP